MAARHHEFGHLRLLPPEHENRRAAQHKADHDARRAGIDEHPHGPAPEQQPGHVDRPDDEDDPVGRAEMRMQAGQSTGQEPPPGKAIENPRSGEVDTVPGLEQRGEQDHEQDARKRVAHRKAAHRLDHREIRTGEFGPRFHHRRRRYSETVEQRRRHDRGDHHARDRAKRNPAGAFLDRLCDRLETVEQERAAREDRKAAVPPRRTAGHFRKGRPQQRRIACARHREKERQRDSKEAIGKQPLKPCRRGAAQIIDDRHQECAGRADQELIARHRRVEQRVEHNVVETRQQQLDHPRDSEPFEHRDRNPPERGEPPDEKRKSGSERRQREREIPACLRYARRELGIASADTDHGDAARHKAEHGPNRACFGEPAVQDHHPRRADDRTEAEREKLKASDPARKPLSLSHAVFPRPSLPSPTLASEVPLNTLLPILWPAPTARADRQPHFPVSPCRTNRLHLYL
tara:strand:- start:48586 stop:49968 length:1383 start_codon:yes stop_codon:yes gene_type:complete